MNDNPFGPWATALSPMTGAKLSMFWLKRLSMLPHLRQSLPILSRRGRYGLFALAMIALVLPSLRGMPAAREGAVDRQARADATTATPKVDTDEQALKEFLQSYRLAPGQNLKRIEPPRPDGIRVYWKRKYPNSQKTPDEVRSFTFGWSDPDELQVGWSLVGGSAGFSIQKLPLVMNMDLFPVEIEGDPDLLNKAISGDWVFREGVPPEELVRPLEAILQRALRLRITLAFRQVEHDVVVVRGRYRSAPLVGRSHTAIEIYGKQLVENSAADRRSGKFPEFLRGVSEWIDRPVVNEVESPPTENVGWHYNARYPSTEQERRQDHDEASVLQHVREQTGLTFDREKKPIRVLFIERAKARSG